MARLHLLFRVVALWFAVSAYAAHGAQAKVVTADNGTLTLPICSVEGTKYITVEVGDDQPVETALVDCGCCLVLDGETPDTLLTGPSLAVAPQLKPRIAIKTAETRSPIWPGAPPIGPPVLQG